MIAAIITWAFILFTISPFAWDAGGIIC